ncbi:uncharacterized protein STEHIDRAFT_94289 [Stereum hirsutum FP-91666 SS1]|uniref:uncharacterized protein n=1 Tax=Stereum hirsutum (strain FP-91666) TaxID=721885 RepID=UPI000440AD47|nr:uncharacterized protein STEHIDRAFT_94289 [Stereum hirsutum FP-91666 SS1]EIM89167.1 hypothetical protein STEHIDRAFT_94289 [Stereum hirsutum FP-91666 SS1]
MQLISIGGVIGTGLFIGSGQALVMAGPLSCLIAYSTYCFIVWCITQTTGELATLLPITGSFITWAHRFVDPAAGVTTGWNNVYACIAFACADITAVTGLFQYWLPDSSPAIWVSYCLVVIFILNAFAVKVYGEAEFYFASGKVILIVGFIVFTFIAMLGGNPHHDRIGFRYWKDPGPMAEYLVDGALGRFLGFWGVFNFAAFSIGGPEFIAMCSSEAERPRATIPKAIRRVFWRLATFYVLGIFCVGILIAYNDEDLINGIATGTAVDASPFVIGMQHLGITVLPHIINAVIITSATSCSNSFVYVASRSLHSLAVNGQAPRILSYTTKSGVPMNALLFILGICCLSYMTVNSGSAIVFGWFVNLASVASLINYSWMCLTWIQFNRGLKAQGIERASLPFKGKFVPYAAWVGLIGCLVLTITNGFACFIKIDGDFDIESFFTAYFGIVFSAVIYCGWKFFKPGDQSYRKPEEMDIFGGTEEIEEDEKWWQENYVPPTSWWGRFMDWLL